MVSKDDIQRLFLQAVLSRGTVSEKLAKTTWARSIHAVQAVDESLDLPDPNVPANWEAFVAKINRSIDPLDLEFRTQHDELTGQEMYALVNRRGDDVAQLATDYSPAEIAYFKAIVEQIMSAPKESYSVSSLVALREVASIKPKSNMTKTQAETVLGSFVAKGWLHKSKRGRFSLATRSLLELQPYLKSTYPDEIIECTICMEMITRGIACYTTNCKTRMHFHCFTAFRRRNGACPSCSVKWPNSNERPLLAIGEGAVKDGDEGRRQTRSRNADVESDEGSKESMSNDEVQQVQPRSQPSRRTKERRG